MSLWLSRVLFARAPTPYGVHGELWRAFPRELPRSFLFRAENVEGDKLRVLVQSNVEPAWDGLTDRLEKVDGPKLFAPEIAREGRFRFFLRANATRAAKASHHALRDLQGEAFREERGRRVGIARDEERVAWLVGQGERCGFRIATRSDGGLLLRVAPPFVTRWRKKDGTVARHDGVDFEGILVVDDAEILRRAITTGIGPAKAFGFGLLSVGPA